jgi:small-conductance mechanosensitive channel
MRQRASWNLPLCLAFALCDPSSSSGQNQKTPDLPAADAEVRLAPVVVDGEVLFSVRGVTAHPAERRAREIADRIRSLAADRDFDPAAITVEDHGWSTWILGRGRRVMALLDEDAVIEETSRQPLAEMYRGRIAEAIESYRQSRQASVLWLHVLRALGVTLAMAAAAYLGLLAIRRVRNIVERHYRRRMEEIQDRAFQIVKADQIWRAIKGLLDAVWGVGAVVGVYFYLNYVLSLFPWTRGIANNMYGAAIEPLRTIGTGIVGALPNLIFLTILVLVTRYALKLTRLFFAGVAGETVKLKGFDPDWAWPTFRLVRIVVILLVLVVAYPYIPGSGTDAFKSISLFMGVIFSLGSSSLIGNFIAGYSMTYRRLFRVGDRVKIGAHVGIVEKMRVLVTHLRTIKNEELVVPNSSILAAEVVNYSSMSREKGLILHTIVGIGYETPWRQVEAMLIEAAGRTPGLLREPPPFILQLGLGDFCVNYEINVFCGGPTAMEELYTDLHRNILDVFNEYGVQIMTPAYEYDPDQPKVVPRDQWYAAPATPPASSQGPHPPAGAASGR